MRRFSRLAPIGSLSCFGAAMSTVGERCRLKIPTAKATKISQAFPALTSVPIQADSRHRFERDRAALLEDEFEGGDDQTKYVHQ